MMSKTCRISVYILVLTLMASFLPSCKIQFGPGASRPESTASTAAPASTTSPMATTAAKPPATSPAATTTGPPAGAWKTVTTPYKNNLLAILWDGSQFVAGGENILLTSKDGQEWKTVYEGPMIISDLAYANRHYVAVTNVSDSGAAQVMTSGNLKDWQAVSIPKFGYAMNNALYSVAGNDAGFFAVGAGLQYVTSPDGLVWVVNVNLQSLPGITVSSLRRIFYSDNRFIVLSQQGRFFFSENGRQWTSSAVPASLVKDRNPEMQSLESVPAKSGQQTIRKLVAGDSKGNVFVSYDNGTSWKILDSASNPLIGKGPLSDILWNGKETLGIWTGFGIASSADGETWQKDSASSVSAINLQRGATNGQVTVVVGLYGIILLHMAG